MPTENARPRPRRRHRWSAAMNGTSVETLAATSAPIPAMTAWASES